MTSDKKAEFDNWYNSNCNSTYDFFKEHVLKNFSSDNLLLKQIYSVLMKYVKPQQVF